jgi:hypothetical protein
VKLIFLDIDGVLNAHEKLPSGYCGIGRAQVDQLNRILAAVSDAKLVISSAWRYLILSGSMTIGGFERLLLTHGVNCCQRLHGHTSADPVSVATHTEPFDAEWWKLLGLEWRAGQIGDYLADVDWQGGTLEMEPFVVLDDLPLVVPNLIQTDGAVGLTPEHADAAIKILMGTA